MGKKKTGLDCLFLSKKEKPERTYVSNLSDEYRSIVLQKLMTELVSIGFEFAFKDGDDFYLRYPNSKDQIRLSMYSMKARIHSNVIRKFTPTNSMSDTQIKGFARLIVEEWAQGKTAKTKELPQIIATPPEMKDFRGIKIGSIKVIGVIHPEEIKRLKWKLKSNDSPIWCVQCECGIYEGRTPEQIKKSLHLEGGRIESCSFCRNLSPRAKIVYKKTGKIFINTIKKEFDVFT